jgi:UDP-3-O-[3-hydroxymyristoyl] glucosamine N-acyltransferase
MKLSKIISHFGNAVIQTSLNIHPDQDLEISGVAAIEEAIAGNISYVEGTKFGSLIASTAASALILPDDEKLQLEATTRGICQGYFSFLSTLSSYSSHSSQCGD